MTITNLPIESIIPNSQVRSVFDAESLAALAATIVCLGVEQPIRVWRNGDQYVIISGERRWRASKIAGLSTIPAIVEDGPPKRSANIERQLVENVQRSDLLPLEKATAIKELMAAKAETSAEVAARLGMSESAVCRLLAILSLPEEIRDQVGSAISASTAYELAKVVDPDEQKRLASEAASGTLSRDALAGRVKASKRRGASSCKAPSKAVAVIAGERQVTISAANLDLDGAVAILETVLGQLRRARTQGLALTTAMRMMKDTSKAS